MRHLVQWMVQGRGGACDGVAAGQCQVLVAGGTEDFEFIQTGLSAAGTVDDQSDEPGVSRLKVDDRGTHRFRGLRQFQQSGTGFVLDHDPPLVGDRHEGRHDHDHDHR